jgi:hypothetical protein
MRTVLRESWRVTLTNLMYWNVGACTILGLRACDNVRHNDATMNSADGKITKNSSSNCILKSNALPSCCSNISSLLVSGIVDDGDMKNVVAVGVGNG